MSSLSLTCCIVLLPVVASLETLAQVPLNSVARQSSDDCSQTPFVRRERSSSLADLHDSNRQETAEAAANPDDAIRGNDQCFGVGLSNCENCCHDVMQTNKGAATTDFDRCKSSCEQSSANGRADNPNKEEVKTNAKADAWGFRPTIASLFGFSFGLTV